MSSPGFSPIPEHRSHPLPFFRAAITDWRSVSLHCNNFTANSAKWDRCGAVSLFCTDLTRWGIQVVGISLPGFLETTWRLVVPKKRRERKE